MDSKVVLLGTRKEPDLCTDPVQDKFIPGLGNSRNPTVKYSKTSQVFPMKMIFFHMGKLLTSDDPRDLRKTWCEIFCFIKSDRKMLKRNQKLRENLICVGHPTGFKTIY